MNCLVSGATGFIGRQLCRELLSRDDSVIALSQNAASLERGLVTHAVDLATDGPDQTLLEGVDVVVHLAGIAHQNAPATAYEQVNVQGTLRLARLALAAGVRCFIFVSSVKAMGRATSDHPRGEEDCTLPVDSYGLSKWQAEVALRNEFVNTGMSVIILRPALVYGENPRGNLQRLAQAVRVGLPRPPLIGERSMIALDDLVRLLLHLIRQQPAGQYTWIVCEQTTYSTQAIYDLLRQSYGKRRGYSWLPRWGWRAAAMLADCLSASGSESTYEKLFGTEVYSNAAILAATSWRPELQLVDVIDHLNSGKRP